MKYKSDWNEAKQRLTALWNHERADRPCIDVIAPSGKRMAGPPPPVAPYHKWMDPDWVLRDFAARLTNTWWGGESVPSCLLMGGWAVCLGGKPHFELATIWFDTMEVDFSAPSPFLNRAEDAWIQAYSELYNAAVDFAGRDDFLVGQAGGLPANDLLSMHMGAEEFLVALLEHPAWMREAIVTGAREQLRVKMSLMDAIRDRHEFWYGGAGWMPFWAPAPFLRTQSDVSCMMSPEMFDEFIVPELDIYGEAFGALWYHLDGGDARQHLPRLLSLPYMRVVQYTPTPSEPPNGPEHLAMYRQIQDAGKIVHIQLPPENIEPLAKALDPALIMFRTNAAGIAEGEALLKAAKHWI